MSLLFQSWKRKDNQNTCQEEETCHKIATLLFPFSTFFAEENGWEIWVWLEVACYHCDFQSWLHFARLSTGANDQGLWRQTRLGESSLSCLEPQDWYIQTSESEVSWESYFATVSLFEVLHTSFGPIRSQQVFVCFVMKVIYELCYLFINLKRLEGREGHFIEQQILVLPYAVIDGALKR